MHIAALIIIISLAIFNHPAIFACYSNARQFSYISAKLNSAHMTSIKTVTFCCCCSKCYSRMALAMCVLVRSGIDSHKKNDKYCECYSTINSIQRHGTTRTVFVVVFLAIFFYLSFQRFNKKKKKRIAEASVMSVC